MHFVDILLIAALALAVLFAVRHVWKNRGACGGDCASCRKSCARQAKKHDEENR